MFEKKRRICYNEAGHKQPFSGIQSCLCTERMKAVYPATPHKNRAASLTPCEIERRTKMNLRKIPALMVLAVVCLLLPVFTGCSNCSEDKTHEHTYTDWSVTTTPSCTEDGVATRTCTICNAADTKPIPKTGHEFGDLVAGTEKTCETDGSLPYYECRKCTKKYDLTKSTELADITLKKGHDIRSSGAATPATCTSDGNYAYSYCAACNKFLDADENELTAVIIPKLNHDFTDGYYPDTPATCETDGYEEHYRCRNCNKCYREDGGGEYTEIPLPYILRPKFNHSGKYYLQQVPASCTGDGTPGTVGHFHCNDCDSDFDLRGNRLSAEDLVIPVRHTMEFYAEQKNTCTEDGIRGHFHCTVCDRNYADADGTTLLETVVTVKTGHDFLLEDGTPDPAKFRSEKPATETENGYIGHYHCARCDKNFDATGSEVGNVLLIHGHNLFWVEETPMNCYGMIEGRRGHYECSDGGCYKYFDKDGTETTLDALTIPVTHRFGSFVKAHDGDCSHKAVLLEHYKCTDCGLYYDAEGKRLAGIDVFGDYGEHDYSVYEYYSEYHHLISCSVCGYTGAQEAHRGKINYDLNAAGEHVKTVDCDACGYVSGEEFYFAAEDVTIAPVVVGTDTLEYMQVIFFRNRGKDRYILSLYNVLDAETIAELYVFLNEFVKDGTKSTAEREITVTYEDFTKAVTLGFVKAGKPLETPMPEKDTYDVDSLDTLSDIRYLLYTLHGIIGINSSDITVSAEDLARFAQVKDLLQKSGGTQTFTWQITQGTGEFAETYTVAVTLTAEVQDFITHFKVEDDVIAGKRPRITAIYYNSGRRVTIPPEQNLYCDEYLFSDFTTPGRKNGAFLYQGVMITAEVTVRGNDEIRSLTLSNSYPDLGETLYLIAEYYSGFRKVLIVTPEMIRSGDLDLTRPGVYSNIVFTYGGSELEIWRIEITDRENQIPEHMYADESEVLWKLDENGNVIVNVTGLTVKVYLKNGDSYRIDISEDMISFDSEEAKAAIAEGEGFPVTVTYLGLTCGFDVYALRGDEDIMYIGTDLHFENNVFGERYLEVGTTDSRKYFTRLMPEMIYNAVLTKGENGSETWEKTTPFDLANAKKGVYDVILVYNGYESTDTAYVYSTGDIVSELICYPFGSYPAGTKESVFKALENIALYYYTYVDFDGEKERLNDNDSLSFPSVHVSVPQGTDFTKAGNIELILSYKNAVSTLKIELISEEQTDAKEYFLINGTRVTKITLYKNGYLFMDGIYTRYLPDEENGLISIRDVSALSSRDMIYKINEESGVLEPFRASTAGEKPFVIFYTTDDTHRYRYEFYDLNGKVYADKYLVETTFVYKDTFSAEFAEDGSYVMISGEGKFEIIEDSDQMRFVMEGKTVYTCTMPEEDEDGKFQRIYFNDNGKAYAATVTENTDGTETVVLGMNMAEWEKEGNLVILTMGGIRIASFEIVNENGTETLVMKDVFIS